MDLSEGMCLSERSIDNYQTVVECSLSTRTNFRNEAKLLRTMTNIVATYYRLFDDNIVLFGYMLT